MPLITIYALKKDGNYFYIGQTVNIEKRIKDHKLKKKIPPGFEYEVLEQCQEGIKLDRERFFIQHYFHLGHNLTNKVHLTEYRLNKIDLEILQLLADDLNNYQIAKIVALSSRTIETRVQRIKDYYGVKHLGGLMYVAFKAGIVG